MPRPSIPGKPELMRQINRTLILDLIRREGSISRAEIAARTGLSAPAVTRTVAALIEEGLVQEVGVGNSSGGRQPILLSFNPKAGFVVVVDIAPYRLLGGVLDLSGDVIFTEAAKVTGLGQPLLDQVTALVEELVHRSGIASENLVGTGLVVPGTPDPGGERVVWAPALQWEDMTVGERLGSLLGFPVTVFNDVDALLLGEYWRGAAVGRENALAITVGSGLGAAMLVDGHLYRGRDGAAGEIGHWLMESDVASTQPAPSHGAVRGFGLLERRVALTVLAEQWAGAGFSPGEGKVDAFVEAALANDRRAIELINGAARVIGSVACNLVCLLNPELVVLGGEILRVSDLILPVVQELIDQYAPYPAPVIAANLAEKSTLLGACYGVMIRRRSSVTFVA